jgi:hypothetical protein
MEIVVSERVEKKLVQLAKINGEDISHFTGKLLETIVKSDFPEMFEDETHKIISPQVFPNV